MWGRAGGRAGGQGDRTRHRSTLSTVLIVFARSFGSSAADSYKNIRRLFLLRAAAALVRVFIAEFRKRTDDNDDRPKKKKKKKARASDLCRRKIAIFTDGLSRLEIKRAKNEGLKGRKSAIERRCSAYRPSPSRRTPLLILQNGPRVYSIAI